jgi:hypothetical protein
MHIIELCSGRVAKHLAVEGGDLLLCQSQIGTCFEYLALTFEISV